MGIHQNSFSNWLLGKKDLYVGRELHLHSKVGNSGTVRIVKMDDKFVWILQPSQNPQFNKPQYATKVPISSLPYLVDDLSGDLVLNNKSGNEYIDAVVNGNAKYLGKGEDGITFHYKDKAIKVATTVPYHAVHYNRPHRTPEEAIENLRNEYKTREKR